MTKLSNARKLGILARVAGKQVRQTRSYGAVLKAGRATFGHFGKVLGQLWLEVTGFVFLVLSAIGGVSLIREYAKYQAGKTTSGRVAAAAGFTLVFGWFGLSSFWRVRRGDKKAVR